MRIGFIGPAEGDAARLRGAAEFLLEHAKVSRIIYLGCDGALESVVEQWARELVGDDPTDSAAWRRAADVATNGTPEEIDRFVEAERRRLRLRIFESLPSGQLRTVEMIGDRIAVLIYDKALLDEEDIFAASLLLFGRSDAPLTKQIGARWFMSPGPLGTGGGLLVLEDEGETITLTLHDAMGTFVSTEELNFPRPGKMRVQGKA